MFRLKSAITLAALAAGACSGGASNIVGPELFTFSATSRVTSTTPMRFETTVSFRNDTPDPIEFIPGCPIPRVLVYSTAARTGTPVWDSNSRAIVCAAVVTPITLASGQSKSYTLTATGTEVLGTSGAAALYYLAGEVTLSGFPIRLNAGELNIAR